MTEAMFIFHAVVTAAMTGLIWFVQVVHYPLFARVGVEQFAGYEAEHQRRTTFVVMPLMLAELGLAVAIAALVGGVAAFVGLGLVVLIWLSTFIVQVPLHRRLERAFDPGVVGALVRTNWIRTVAWTARSTIAGWMILDLT